MDRNLKEVPSQLFGTVQRGKVLLRSLGPHIPNAGLNVGILQGAMRMLLSLAAR